MTKREKREFIRDLMGTIQKQILETVPKMPEEWDGFELRQLLADKFQGETCQMGRKRLKAYRAELTNRNI